MAVTPAILLAKLQGLDIATDVIDHPAVRTVEEANKHTGNVPGKDVKNLFLKDKKNRLFLVTADTSTKVDLKVLSLRLGLPKPGLRFAPDEVLDSILGVSPGSVTPLAVVQETASAVTLLLDDKLKGQDRILVHPLVNNSTVAISSEGLEKFLMSMDRQAHYVDLEAQPETGPNQADLRHLLPTEAAAEPAALASASGSAAQPSPAFEASAGAPSSSATHKEAKVKPSKKGNTESNTPASTAPPPSIQDISARILQQILKGVGVDTSLSAESTKQMADSIFMELNALQNRCYSNGYMAGKQEVAKYCLSTFGS